MRLDLTSRQIDSEEADLAEPFSVLKFSTPHAKSCPKSISDAFKYHEIVKTLKYQQRILDVDHSSFVLLIFACTGGAAPGSTKTVQKLAEKLSEKRNESYSDTINIRTKIRFALLWIAILCLKTLPNTGCEGIIAYVL